MLAVTIDECRHGAPTDVVDAAANERKAVAGEIFYRRCEVELGVEPGLYRMLVRGCDIDQAVVRLHAAHVARENLVGNRVAACWGHVVCERRAQAPAKP